MAITTTIMPTTVCVCVVVVAVCGNDVDAEAVIMKLWQNCKMSSNASDFPCPKKYANPFNFPSSTKKLFLSVAAAVVVVVVASFAY